MMTRSVATRINEIADERPEPDAVTQIAKEYRVNRETARDLIRQAREKRARAEG